MNSGLANPPRRVGVIDLGTNTFNLMIADLSEDHFTLLYNEKEGVALGMGGINKGIIAEDAFERGIQTLRQFRHICKEYGAEEIRAIGTSALRSAKNAPDFVQHAFLETGIQIYIISGEEEALLIYKGVSWSYNFAERSVIMDIGGGSTEFIFADQNGIEEVKSLNIGISRIIQDLDLHDPLSGKNIQNIESWLDQHSGYYFENKQCDILIGASGSFETFHEMIYRQKFPAISEAIEVPLHQIQEILHWIISSNQLQRDLHPYIIPIRKKMAPIAAVKTAWIIRKLKVKRILITPFALKEGVLKMGEELPFL